MMRGGDRMNAITYNAWNPRHLGYVIVFTALINGSLFAALPWLTRIVSIKPPREDVSPYIVLPKTQPKPLEPIKDRRIIDPDLKPLHKPTLLDSAKQNLKRDFDILTGLEGLKGDVKVAVLDSKSISVDPKDFIFELDQLDKEPSIIRKVPPIYPFAAKKQGIKARVKIRIIDGIQKTAAPEYDDCKRLAQEYDIPIREVFDFIKRKAESNFEKNSVGGID